MKQTLIAIILSVLLCTLAITTTLGQDRDTQYLINMTDTKITGFGSINYESSFTNGSPTLSSGGAGAVLFNYSFFIGGYGMDIITNPDFPDIYPAAHNPTNNPLNPNLRNNRLRFNHGGLWLGYIHHPNNLWHVGGNIRIGRGKIALYDDDIKFREFDENHRDWVGVITPELDLEVNIARWFKISFSVGYRYVYGIDSKTFTNSEGMEQPLYESNKFSSPVASIRFHFGAFGPRTNGK